MLTYSVPLTQALTINLLFAASTISYYKLYFLEILAGTGPSIASKLLKILYKCFAKCLQNNKNKNKNNLQTSRPRCSRWKTSLTAKQLGNLHKVFIDTILTRKAL